MQGLADKIENISGVHVEGIVDTSQTLLCGAITEGDGLQYPFPLYINNELHVFSGKSHYIWDKNKEHKRKESKFVLVDDNALPVSRTSNGSFYLMVDNNGNFWYFTDSKLYKKNGDVWENKGWKDSSYSYLSYSIPYIYDDIIYIRASTSRMYKYNMKTEQWLSYSSISSAYSFSFMMPNNSGGFYIVYLPSINNTDNTISYYEYKYNINNNAFEPIGGILTVINNIGRNVSFSDNGNPMRVMYNGKLLWKFSSYILDFDFDNKTMTIVYYVGSNLDAKSVYIQDGEKEYCAGSSATDTIESVPYYKFVVERDGDKYAHETTNGWQAICNKNTEYLYLKKGHRVYFDKYIVPMVHRDAEFVEIEDGIEITKSGVIKLLTLVSTSNMLFMVE